MSWGLNSKVSATVKQYNNTYDGVLRRGPVILRVVGHQMEVL